MPRSIRNPKGYTIRKLIQNTYHHFPNRYDFKDRDVLKRVTVQKVTVYGGKTPGEARTKYILRTYSYPQYSPYYTRKDSRGRSRSYQRSYRHEYECVIQLDKLSIDTDRFKLRTGADAKWDFSQKGRTKKDRRTGKITEGTNIKRGLNGDHFFRLSWIRKQDGILFGRNFANGPPIQTNPHMIQFLTKHELRALEFLINKGILQ